MPYGSILADTLQSSTSGTPPVFKDGNGTTTGTLCRAWVAFNATTSTINGSFNITSITQVSTGNWQLNFTNAMPDTNYATVVGVNGSSIANFGAAEAGNVGGVIGTTSYCGVRTYITSTATLANLPYVNVAIFR